jgi:hypothetical protein
VEGIESDSEAITKDIMALAVYSNQSYGQVYDMTPKERKLLADVLKEKADAEEKAIKSSR